MTGAVGHFTAVTHHKCHTNIDWLQRCALFTETWPFKGGLSAVGGGWIHVGATINGPSKGFFLWVSVSS